MPAMPDTTAPSDDPLAAPRQRLIERLLRLVRDGELGPVPGVPAMLMARQDQTQRDLCAVYEPCVAVVLQGRKQVEIGGGQYVYDANRYFVTPLEVPALAVVMEASPARPFLSVALRLDLRELAALVLEGAVPPPAPPAGERRAMATGALNAPLLDAFDRLLALAEEPQHAAALAPLIQREILYRLLTGDAGWRLRQIVSAEGQGRQVARAIELLRARYGEPLRIEDLARVAAMGVSTLHHHFKALTGLSPLQYQKELRLAEARRLMLAERLDAAAAAYRVGYESASQFSREYSRRFGAPPMRDIAGMRSALLAEPL